MEDKAKIVISSAETIVKETETDEEFLNYIRKINDKKNSSSSKLFGQSDLEFSQADYELINELALYHAQSNTLNSTSSKQFKEIKNQQKCRCGCRKGFGELLPLFFNEQKLSFLGSGIILFFFYLKNMRLLIFFSFFLFSAFSIVTNISFNPRPYDCTDSYFFLTEGICIYNEISTFNSISSMKSIMNIQLWLGFCFCLVWIIGVRFITLLGNKKDQEIDESLNSASDYTLRIENLPFGEYNEYELMDFLNEIGISQPNPVEIISIQIIYNMDQSRRLINQIRSLSEILCAMLERINDGRILAGKVEEFKQNKKILALRFDELEKLRGEFQSKEESRRRNSTTIALAEFPSPQTLNEFLKITNPEQNPLEETLMPDNSVLFKGKRLIIKRAPEPSDIMWLNCEKDVSGFRFLMIWLAVFFVLYVGYAAISYSQTLNFVRKSIGIVASALLQLFNRLIWLILSFLVTFEYNNTKTEAIISLMKKSILAQTINIIVTPMISKFVNGRELYGDTGVSGMAVTYQFVMVIMMFFYYIFNPLQIGKSFLLKVKCIRDWMIRKNCDKNSNDLKEMDLSKVFSLYEGPDFPVAGAYVYMTTATFHGLFYCHLQPIILLLVGVNMTIFTAIMKYMLYRRCKIPELTHVQVFDFAMFVISWGVVFYGAGSIFFLIIDENVNVSGEYYILIPSFLSVVIWFISTLNLCNIFKHIDAWGLNLMKNAHKEVKRGKKTHFRGTIHVDNVSEEVSDEEKIRIWSRKECYYTDCNTNILFDYEEELCSYSSKYNKRGLELKKFCEKFNTIETFTYYERNDQDLLKQEPQLKVNTSSHENSTNFLKLKKIYENAHKVEFVPVIFIGKEEKEKSRRNKLSNFE